MNRSPALGAALAGAWIASLASAITPARADTLDAIRAQGRLDCAISQDLDDYSQFDAHGDLSAFETDLCGAVAAAILGDPHKAAIRRKGDEISALHDLADGHAQLMIGTTPDPALGLGLKLGFGPAVLVDGNGFLVDTRDHVRTLGDLEGRRICWIDGTEAATSLPARMGELGIRFVPDPFQERGEMESALATGHCNAVTGEVTELANLRLGIKALRDHFEVMRQTYTVDPVAPAFRAGDPRFAAVVGAVMTGLVQAGEHGITRANARSLASAGTDPIQRMLLGRDPWIGRALGLPDHWLLDAVAAVGNQAEIYQRDVGAGSPLDLPVGANAPILAGGALMSLPVEPSR